MATNSAGGHQIRPTVNMDSKRVNHDRLQGSPGLEIDQSLFSLEKMRASPELWPEQIPGVSGFAGVVPGPSPEHSPVKNMQLDTDDMGLLQEFGSLTTSQLLEKVRGLQNLAYQLGLEETHEMTRGKFLNILDKVPKRT